MNPFHARQSATLSRRFLSGATWALIGKVLSATATLGANALLARLLTPTDMGSYFLIFSVVTVCSIVGQFGLDRGMVKLIAPGLASGHSRLVRENLVASFAIVLGISLVVGACLVSKPGRWVLGSISGSAPIVSLAALIAVWIVISALQGLVRESFRGFHDIRLATVFGGLVTAVVSLGLYLSLWFRYGHARLELAVQLMILASGFSLLCGGVLLITRARALERSVELPLKAVFRFGFPLALTNLALFSVREFHVWVLALFQPASEVALYGAAIRLVTLVSMPLMIVGAVIPPMVAEYYHQKQREVVQRILQKTATAIGIPALFAFALLVAYGDELLGLVFGYSYRQAYLTLAIISGGQLLNVLTGSPGVLLTMSGHERVVMISAVTSGIIGMLISFVAAPKLGSVGVALGYSVGIFLVNTAMCIFSARRLSIRTHGSWRFLRELTRK